MSKKQDILTAALNLFTEQGARATSTKSIALEAGVSEALIFKHFGTKDNLLEDLIKKGYVEAVRITNHFLNAEKESDFLEGCLSFPDLFGTVKRYLKIEVVWEEIVAIGNPPKTKVLRRASKILEGFEAIVWQHESDHLEGILFVDRIKEEGGKFYLWTEDKKVLMDVDEILTKEK